MTTTRPRTRARATLAAVSAAVLVAVGLVVAPVGVAAAAPGVVTLVGSLQNELGCAGDWDPGCATTDLASTSTAGVFAADFTVPAGSWEYKVAFEHGWDGAVGLDGGASNIPLTIGGPATLRFSYNSSTQRVAVTPLNPETSSGLPDAPPVPSAS